MHTRTRLPRRFLNKGDFPDVGETCTEARALSASALNTCDTLPSLTPIRMHKRLIAEQAVLGKKFRVQRLVWLVPNCYPACLTIQTCRLGVRGRFLECSRSDGGLPSPTSGTLVPFPVLVGSVAVRFLGLVLVMPWVFPCPEFEPNADAIVGET